MENAEYAALVLLVQDWNSIAPWLVESLFDDDANRMAFLALAGSGGDLQGALDAVAPDARDVLERAAVADLTLVPEVEAKTLIAAAVRRELRLRVGLSDRAAIDDDRQARLDIEQLADRRSTTRTRRGRVIARLAESSIRGTPRWGQLNQLPMPSSPRRRHTVSMRVSGMRWSNAAECRVGCTPKM